MCVVNASTEKQRDNLLLAVCSITIGAKQSAHAPAAGFELGLRGPDMLHYSKSHIKKQYQLTAAMYSVY